MHVSQSTGLSVCMTCILLDITSKHVYIIILYYFLYCFFLFGSCYLDSLPSIFGVLGGLHAPKY